MTKILVQAGQLQSRREALHLLYMSQGSNKYSYAGLGIPILRQTCQFVASLHHVDCLTTSPQPAQHTADFSWVHCLLQQVVLPPQAL